ncbi:tetratricopeptide repeat protein [Halomonas sp. Bachu 37]|uniref:YfgM family protein n=1 Tax=Halomonas kashgarensis TaxID=3084920 RepID=UPI003217F6EF
MAELRTEEEQLDALKRWWKANGTSLIAGVVIAAAGVFGWNAWENYQANQAQAASMRYQQLATVASDSELDDAGIEQARRLVDELVDEHGGTLYAELALLLDTRLAVQQGDLEGAQAALEQVIDTSSRRYVQSLARLRLARLALEADDAERALTLLDDPISDALSAQRANVRGDALSALGRDDEARQAWQEALAMAEAKDQPLYGVSFKLDDLGTQETAL